MSRPFVSVGEACRKLSHHSTIGPPKRTRRACDGSVRACEDYMSLKAPEQMRGRSPSKNGQIIAPQRNDAMSHQ